MDYLGISQESSHLLISIITKKRHQLQILQNLKLDLTNSNDVKRLYNLIYDGEKKILITGLSASVFVLKTFLEKQGFPIGNGENCNFHCSLASLPHLLKISKKEAESPPYLRATKPANFEKYSGCKVGLVWAGSPRHARDELRSCKLNNFKPLFEIPNINFFSLQKDLRKRVWGESEPVDLAKGCKGMKLIDMSEFITDWEDTAAMIAAMDLIITVDTAVLHLAGAMGKKTWALIPYNPDWRWGLPGLTESTFWYPSVKLFRQPKRRDWESVINSIYIALDTFRQSSFSNM